LHYTSDGALVSPPKTS